MQSENDSTKSDSVWSNKINLNIFNQSSSHEKSYNFSDLTNKTNCHTDHFVKAHLMYTLYIYIDDNSLWLVSCLLRPNKINFK